MDFIKKIIKKGEKSQGNSTNNSASPERRISVLQKSRSSQKLSDKPNGFVLKRTLDSSEEAIRMQEYVDTNFVTITRKYHHLDESDNQAGDSKDLAIYFDEDDRFYIEETDEAKIFKNEFSSSSKNYKLQDLKLRIEKLERYDKKLYVRIKKSAVTHYDKFEKGLDRLAEIKDHIGVSITKVQSSRANMKDLKVSLAAISRKIIQKIKEKKEKEAKKYSQDITYTI